MQNFLCATLSFLTLSIAQNTCVEPESTGGEKCSNDLHCNFRSFGQNFCDFNDTIGFCVCARNYAKPDCSYERYNPILIGALQLIPGVGNFVIGRTSAALTQLLLFLGPSAVIFFLLIRTWLEYPDFKKEIKDVCWIITFGIFGSIATSGVIYSLVDSAFIFSGNVPDGNGYVSFGATCLNM